MGGFDILCPRQIDQDHEAEKGEKFFLDHFVVPLHPQDFLGLWDDQIPHVIDRQQVSFMGGLEEGLGTVTDLCRMKGKKSSQ